MNQERSERSNGTTGVVGSLAEFGNDVATLAELQAKLVALDFRESVGRAKVSLLLAGTGAVMAMACLPVILLGVSALIATLLSIHQGWAMLLTAAVVLSFSAAAIVVGGRTVIRSLDAFQRSRDELSRNVSWIRTVLLHSGRSVPRRRV